MGDQRVRPTHNPFALPSGPLGRFAGWVMSRDDRPHREVVELLAPRAAAVICEIGFGPGQFLALLADRDPEVHLCGVDPSPIMLAQARRRLQDLDSAAARTADLRLGAAGALPFADHCADYLVAINTVASWPDLPDALREAHRILRPGGTLLLAWHSAGAPSPMRRLLAKSAAWWNGLL